MWRLSTPIMSVFSRPARGLTRAVIALVFVVASLASTTFPAYAENCQFSTGFGTLHNLIPAIVGTCVSNEIHNGTTGDALQRTTNGLLVWRKADNFTAFTDGERTWIIGPRGLQERLNNARFTWEPDVAPSNIDPRLSVAYRIAAQSRLGNLIAFAVAQRVPVGVGTLPVGAAGAFSPAADRILISSEFLGGDPRDAAAILVHESTHASDLARGLIAATPRGCIAAELRARSNELGFWRDQFGPTGKPNPVNELEKSENFLLGLAESNLQAFLVQTLNDYRSECGL